MVGRPEQNQELTEGYNHFTGLDERFSEMTTPRGYTRSLLNVDLSVENMAKKRTGYVTWETPDEGVVEPVEGLGVLEKIVDGRHVMLACQESQIMRAVIREGDPITWEVARKPNPPQAGLHYSMAVGHFVEYPTADGSPIEVQDRGSCMYIANGQHTPMVERGFATSLRTGTADDPQISSMTKMVAGVYGDGIPGSGTPGIPTADTGGPEFRDWTADPPAGFMLRGQGTTERLFAWGFDDDPTRVDFSEVGVPYNFLKNDVDGDPPADNTALDGGYFRAIRNDGDSVVAVIELFDLLIVLKKKKVCIYTGVPGVDLTLVQTKPVGCTSLASVQRVGDNLYWWSKFGPVDLHSVDKYSNVDWAQVGDKANETVRLLSAEDVDNVRSVHDIANNRVMWFAGDTVFALYYNGTPRWSLFRGSFASVNSVIYAPDHDQYGDVIYGGKDDGTVVRMGIGYADGDDDIEMSWVTSWYSGGDPMKRLRILRLAVIHGDLGAIDLEVYVGHDFIREWTEIEDIARSRGEPPSVWDSGRWDEMRWDDAGPMIQEYTVEGNPFLYRLKFEAISKTACEIVAWAALLEQWEIP